MTNLVAIAQTPYPKCLPPLISLSNKNLLCVKVKGRERLENNESFSKLVPHLLEEMFTRWFCYCDLAHEITRTAGGSLIFECFLFQRTRIASGSLILEQLKGPEM